MRPQNQLLPSFHHVRQTKAIYNLLDQLAEADPIYIRTRGRKTPFIRAIMKWWVFNRIRIPEDIETTRELLTKFNTVSNQIPDFRNVEASDFDSPGDLREMIAAYMDDTDDFDHYAGLPLIGSLDDVKMYKIDNWDQGIRAFADSGWCVKDKQHFDRYGPPFYMFVQNNKRAALLHIPSAQLMDVYDRPLTLANKVAPTVAELIKRNVPITLYVAWDTHRPVGQASA